MSDVCATVALPAEALDAIAVRVAEMLKDAAMDAGTPWMTLDEAADYLRWPKQRLYKLTAADAIPMRRHGNRILFNRDELDTWLDDFREGPACAGLNGGRMLAPIPKRPRGAANARGPAQGE